MVRRLINGALDILHRTKAEILIATLSFATFGGIMGHRFELNRDKLIPLAFSEVSQLEDAAIEKDTRLDALTSYYARLNDLTMKVFESWNDAWRYSRGKHDAYSSFATILNERLTQHKYRNNLADFLEQVPDSAEGAKEVLGDYSDAIAMANSAARSLKAAWKHSPKHHYELELEPYTYIDANGDLQHDTRLVNKYQHTDHTFFYNPGHGAKAADTLELLLQNYSDLTTNLVLQKPETVHQENLDAINSSREKEADDNISHEKALEYALRWNTGASYTLYRKHFVNPWIHVREHIDLWSNASKTARTVTYRTNRKHDNGPKQYQIAQRTIQTIQDASNPIHEVLDGIQFASQTVPNLEEQIRNYVEAVHSGTQTPSTKQMSAMAHDIKETAANIYQNNITGGFEVERYRVWALCLYIAVGALVGSGAGYLIDRYTSGRNTWKSLSSTKLD